MSGLKRGRALALIAVLVVVATGALAGTTILYLAEAERAAVSGESQRAQARALAWSGVQVVMSELASQRDGLLRGEPARITDRWVVFEEGRGGERVRGLFRVVPMAGRARVSEAGKLDLNTATAEMLAGLPGIDAVIADRIVERRSGRPFTSPLEILDVEGIDGDLYYGDGQWHWAGVEDERGLGGLVGGEGDALPLSELVTVFAFDPNLQMGLGDGAGAAGRKRINLNVTWSERLAEAIAERFGSEAARAVGEIMRQGTEFNRDSDMVRVMRAFNVPHEAWAEILDAFTTTDDEFVLGRVDLNTAPAEVLACIPGIDAEAAEEIVFRRERVADEMRLTRAWPMLEGIVSPEQFEEAVDYLTTRSAQWRFVIEAGIEVGEGGDGPGGIDPPPIFDDMDDAVWREVDGVGRRELRNRVVLEVVVDVASSRPRIAYLRDATMLPVSRAIAAAMPRAERAEEPVREHVILEENDTGMGAETARRGAGRSGRLAEQGMGVGMGADEPARPGNDSAMGMGGDAGEGEESGPDRRIGRWTTGSGSRR